MSLSSAVSFGAVDSSLTLGMNHLCERQALLGVPQQVVTLTANAGVSVDLMQLAAFGFFRANRPGLPHHAANLSTGYGYSRNMIITANIQEDAALPQPGHHLQAGPREPGPQGERRLPGSGGTRSISPWTRRREKSREDDIYFSNLSGRVPFREEDRGYRFTAFYETDVLWLHTLFSRLYELASQPIFSLEYSLLLNRYDYSVTVAPEPSTSTW